MDKLGRQHRLWRTSPLASEIEISIVFNMNRVMFQVPLSPSLNNSILRDHKLVGKKASLEHF